jgi:hypothetical protein
MHRSYVHQSIAVFAIALLSLAGMQSVNAQAVWQQNIEIRVPVERGSAISAFRDALIEEIREQSESEDAQEFAIKRRSRDQETQDLSSIESELISEGWGGLSIANTLYISYTFAEGRNGFREQITSINFLRQQDGEGPDVPVFYMDTEDSQFFSNFLRREGVQGGMGGNIAHQQPFRDILLFGRLMRQQDQSIVTAVNGQAVNADEVTLRTRQVVDRIIEISLASR